MRTSNLAQRLEEFAATLDAVDAPKEKPPCMFAAVIPSVPGRAPPRLTPRYRRIQIHDQGLRSFRVF